MASKDHIAEELAYVMPRIARILTSSFMKSVPLPPAQLFALLELQENQPCHLSDISRALHVSAPTATGVIERLVKIGYVNRQHGTEDRRRIVLRLSAQGEKVASRVRQGIIQRWGFVLEKMTQADARDYLRIVKDMQNRLYDQGKRHENS